MRCKLTAIPVMACAVLFVAALGEACMVIPRPRPVPAPNPVRDVPLEIRDQKITVNISDNVATTEVATVFYNPRDCQVEGEFIYPLPEGAAVSKFAMDINGKEVEGEILELDKARSMYEQIVRRMIDPALLEYTDRKAFRCRVFPIPPRGEKRVRLVYSEVLRGSDGLYGYSYPLNLGRFAPSPIGSLALSIRIESRVPIKNIFSPTHESDVTRSSDRKAAVGFEAKNIKPDKDYALYYSLSEGELGFGLIVHRGAGQDGYFCATIAPRVEAAAREIEGKDVVFVLDTSGSMQGEKLAQAKAALKFCLGALNPRDRFNVVEFATAVRSFREGLVEAAAEGLVEAQRYVEALSARGGTNISEALAKALSGDAPRDGRPSMIVFITDGEPTVGETSPEKIVAAAAALNKRGARIFTFGVGHDLNARLLDKLAGENGGEREYVQPGENIELKVSIFYAKVSHPVLSDLKLDFGKAGVYDVYPERLPDLFRGSQIVILGRYSGEGHEIVKLTGAVGGKREEFVFEGAFARSESAGDFIPRLWALRKVGFLLDQIRLNGEKKELKDEIVKLSTEHGIMTPYTAYLVQEEFKLGDAGARPMAAPAAAAVRALDLKTEDEAADRAMTRAGANMKAAGGRGGVESSVTATKMRTADSLSGADREGEKLWSDRGGAAPVKSVGDSAFYLVSGVWTEATFKQGIETTKVKYLSEEYFKFLRNRPAAGKFLALGERVIFRLDEKWYEIAP